MDIILPLKQLALKLPKPLRELLRYPWQLWCSLVVWDKDMVRAIAGYFSISESETRFLLKTGGSLDSFFWKYLTKKGIQNTFYQVTPFYIFELAYWHMTNYQRVFRKKILSLAKGRVLDFGGGIGDLALVLSKKDLQVTYADVEGETFSFAQYLFSRHSAAISTVNLTKEKITGSYDTIICLDVIEHLENKRELLDTFSSHLNPGGSLIITNLGFSTMDQEQQANHPMHIPFDFDGLAYLKERGFTQQQYPWLLRKTSLT